MDNILSVEPLAFVGIEELRLCRKAHARAAGALHSTRTALRSTFFGLLGRRRRCVPRRSGGLATLYAACFWACVLFLCRSRARARAASSSAADMASQRRT